MSDLNIYQRILAVMAELKYVQKGEKTVNNQYRFVGHDAVSEAIHPMLVKHGIVMIPSVSGWKQDGNRTEVDVTVSFVNADKPEDRFEVQTFGFGVDGQDKGPGKAVSYATKYAVLKTFVLETGDDPEKDSIDHIPASEASKTANTETLAKDATDALDRKDWVSLCVLDREHGEDWLAVWKTFTSGKRKQIKDLMAKGGEYRDLIQDLTQKEDDDGLAQIFSELDKDGLREVYRRVDDAAKAKITEYVKGEAK
jgi:hypothetical protein